MLYIRVRYLSLGNRLSTLIIVLSSFRSIQQLVDVHRTVSKKFEFDFSRIEELRSKMKSWICSRKYVFQVLIDRNGGWFIIDNFIVDFVNHVFLKF